MASTIVLKFGGSVLEDETAIQRAVGLIRDVVSRNMKVAIVVSAMKGVTDHLLQSARQLNPKVSDEILDEVISMGERTSARLFAAALSKYGLNPVVIDPSSDAWPIISDDKHLDANPLMEETRRLVQSKLMPILESGEIPVICGFIGRTSSGKITTLGRGGSDTTATVLGSCLDAREVVLVKDVEGVFSSDPDKVPNPVLVRTLDAEEAQVLSAGGAKFLHVKALRYKHPHVRVRIASLANGAASGTIIDGGSTALQVESTGKTVTMYSIVGTSLGGIERIPSILDRISNSNGKVLALSLEEKSLILYVEEGTALLQPLHQLVVEQGIGKAVTAFENLAAVVVHGSALETSPGMIQRVTQPLARHGINIFGLLTISSSIRVFIPRDHVEKALSLMKAALLVN